MSTKSADKIFRVLFIFVFIIGMAGMPITRVIAQSPLPELTLEKSATPAIYSQVGDVINYSYLLTNTGSGTLSGPFTVIDDKTTVTCPGDITPVELSNTLLFDHFENGNLAQYASGTPDYVSGLNGFGQAVDFSSGAWFRYNVPGWYQWPSTYNPAGKAGSVDFWVYPKQYNIGLVNLNWHTAYTPPGDGHILHLDIDSNGKLVSGAWSAISGPALIQLPGGNATIPLNQWTHVAYTWGADGTRLFVNGVQDAYSPDNLYPALNTSNYLYVPNWGVLGIGYMDDLRITSSSQTNFGVSALQPGESITCHGSYVITQNDVDNGSVTNIAQAHAFFGATLLDSNQAAATVSVNSPPSFTMHIRAYIDGTSQLVIRGDTAYWHHIGADAPGRTGGHYDPTYLNGTEWYPAWPDSPDERNRDCNCDSSMFTGLTSVLPQNGRYKLNLIQARYSAFISQQPNASNNYTLIVDFDDGPPGGGDWYEVELAVDTRVMNPNIVVRPLQDFVHGWGWPEGATISLTLDDPDTLQSPDYSETQIASYSADWRPEDTLASFVNDALNIKPGDIVTMTDGTTHRTHVVTNLAVTGFDVVHDRVSGTTDPFATVTNLVDNGNNNYDGRTTIADEHGNWTTDFSVPGDSNNTETIDIQPGTEGIAIQNDEDGDATHIGWTVPNPRFDAWYRDGYIVAFDWPLGTLLTLEIEDSTTPQSPDYSTTTIAGMVDGDPIHTHGEFQLNGAFEIQAGMTLTISGAASTRELVVSNLTITSIDQDTEIITGGTEPNQTMWMNLHNSSGTCCRNFQADGGGIWTVNYSQPGPNGEQIEDIRPGSSGTINAQDDDGDNTSLNWNVPNPSIAVRANNNSIEGWEWTLGSTITITVDDPGTDSSPDITRTAVVYQPDWNPNERRFDLNLNGEFDIKAGNVVTASDGITTKTHTVTSLAFTDINIDNDTVTGIAEASSRVDIWTCDDFGCYNIPTVVTDGNGVWVADFTGIHDIVRGSWVDSSQNDEDGDSTFYGKNVPNPRFDAWYVDGNISAYDWPLDTLLTLEIEDTNTPASPDYWTTTIVGTADWDPNQTLGRFNLYGVFQIQPGMTLTVSGASISKELLVSNLTITGVDKETDIITGGSEPNQQMWMNFDNSSGDCCREFQAADNGVWSVDYSQPGLNGEPVEDVRPGSSGTINAKDDDGDNTSLNWNVLNPRVEVMEYADRIALVDWPAGLAVHVTIGDVASPDYEQDFMPDQDWTYYEFFTIYDIKTGDILTATNGDITKTLRVTVLQATEVDRFTGTVNGVATPNSQFNVDVSGDHFDVVPVTFNVNVDGDGNWSGNYGNIPGSLLPWTWAIHGEMRQSDDDGDVTIANWHNHWGVLEVWMNEAELRAFDWELGTTLTFTVDDPATYPPVDFTEEMQTIPMTWMDHGQAVLSLAGKFDLQVGMIVSVTDGTKTKTTTIQNIGFNKLDANNDVAGGFAPANVNLDLIIGKEYWSQRYFSADANGVWLVDYNTPDVAGRTLDLQTGDQFHGLFIRDEEFDSTVMSGYIPNYILHAVPTHPEVHGHDWLTGTEVTLIIDNDTDPTNGALYTRTKNANEDPWCGYPCFDLAGEFELQVGQYVTMTDGTISKTVHVSTLKVITVDLANDTLSGIADPGSDVMVNIWSQDGKSRHTVANTNGNWTVDFSVFGDEDFEQFTTDITSEDNGRAIQLNPDGTDDGTLEYWPILNNPPDANAGPDRSIFVGDTITLDASASSDPEAGALTYKWDLDNDGLYDDANGVTVTTSFNQTGNHIIGLLVTDEGGLTDTDTVTITVLSWTLRGFYQPVDMNGVFNIVKGGSTVPFKFEIFAGSTELTDIADVLSFTYIPVACASDVPVDTIETTVIGGTSLRYDTAAGQFIYNWKTPKNAGKCYRVTMTTIDGSSLVAYFKLK